MDANSLRKIIRNHIAQLEGNEFQAMCDRLGVEQYPGDYQPVRPGGSHGDTKNDGYCPTARVFFAAHATRGESAKKTKDKINGDLDGCLANHRDVKVWRYHTNATLTGEVDQFVDNELRPTYPNVTIEIWGHERLADEICKLSPAQIEKIIDINIAASLNSAIARDEILVEAADMSRGRLIASWQAAGVSDELAQSLADDPTIGAWERLDQQAARANLIIVEGDFGSGKSVTAERWHAANISAALAALDAPIPIHLSAKSVSGQLENVIREHIKGLGNPKRKGVHLVLDGLDEPGLVRAEQLAQEARILVNVWPNSRIVMTVRPGILGEEAGTRISHPRLSEAEAKEFVERLGAHHSALEADSEALRAMLHLPLFATIAAMRQQAGQSVPRTMGTLLEALAERARRKAPSQVGSTYETLKKLARLAVNSGGLLLAAEVGDSEAVRAAIESRLVVRDGRTLRFALPVLEQYFGAQAVLQSGFDKVVDTNDPLVLDRWRYSLALALTVGSWSQTSALMKAILSQSPGLAAWLITNSIPNHMDKSETSLPDDLECARRIRHALLTWLSAFTFVGEMSELTDHNKKLRTIGVAASGSRMDTALRKDDSTESGIARLPYDYNPFSGAGISAWSAGRGSSGVPVDFSVWPWRWSFDWFRDSLEAVLLAQTLTLPRSEPFTQERQWALARVLTETSGHLRHAPIQIARAVASAKGVLRHLSKQVSPLVNINPGFGKGVNSSADELVGFVDRLEKLALAGETLIHRPYPVPDNELSRSGFIDGLYTSETLRSLVEHVYSNALVIYNDLVDAYFPSLRSTLGLACIMPVLFRGNLEIAEDGLSSLHCTMEPAPLGRAPRAEINLASEPVGGFLDFDEWRTKIERNNRLWRTARPGTEGWSHPRLGTGAIGVFRDTPATCQAYNWLWGDLKALHLVERLSPSREDW